MIKIKKKILFIFLTALICANVYAFVSYPKASLTVDKYAISIGEDINATVELSLPDSIKLLYGEDDIFIEGWDIKNISLKRDFKREGKYVLEMAVTTYDSTVQKIPRIRFSYVNKNMDFSFSGEKFYFFSNFVEVKVFNIFDDDKFENIKDIKKTKHLKVPFIYYLLFMLAYLSLAFYIYTETINYKVSKLIKIKNLTPSEIAFRDINRMFVKEGFSKDKIKDYYYELSDVFKKFIINILALKTPELTTTDLLNLLNLLENEDSWYGRNYEEICFLFDHYDDTKYADSLPDEQKFFEILKRTKDLIKQYEQFECDDQKNKEGN